MYDSGISVRTSGNDLVFAVTIVDGLDRAITSGQTVSFSILQNKTDKYWNIATNAFDLANEGTLINVPHVENGVYQRILTNGYVPKSDNFRLHIVATGNYEADFGYVNSLNSLPTITALSKQGFRRERISREDLKKQNEQILIEVRNINKNVKTKQIPGGFNAKHKL